MGKANDYTDAHQYSQELIDDLFSSLAEQVKMPFVQIAYAAELMGSNQNEFDSEVLRKTIALSSKNALRLIDAYLLSITLQRQGRMQLEPVSVSSVLYDSAQTLEPFAKALGCKIKLNLVGKYEPVMAHRLALQSALVSLGYNFIEAATSQESNEPPVVSFVVRRRSGGISTGVFSNNVNLSSTLLERAKKMHGKVHQPLPNFDSGSGIGLFIAESLFSQLDTSMKIAQEKGLHGIAATLTPSRQLNLV